MFSETLLDHFQSPRNVGEIEDADAEAEDENPVCGDELHLWLRIQDSFIQDAKWRARGCAPAIAAASATSELLKGMAVDEAAKLTATTVEESLGGLPPRKAHAALLAVSTVRRALAQYETSRTT
jgi:nitrogen fixation protein NifU and related proteins